MEHSYRKEIPRRPIASPSPVPHDGERYRTPQVEMDYLPPFSTQANIGHERMSGTPPVYLPPNLGKPDAFTVRETDRGYASSSQTPTLNLMERGDNYGFGGTDQPPAPSKLKGNVTVRILKSWPLELLACLLIVLLIVAQIMLLLRYDGEFVSVWSHEWKINSVFAFLTTLLEASMTSCVLTCIGQLRWLWYEKKPDALMWMDMLTKMHSAPGAVMFLATKGSFRRFATLGALIIVALLGTSTFVQNVIIQRSEERVMSDSPDDPLAVAFVLTDYGWYAKGTTGEKIGDEQPFAPMIGAINSGFFSPSSFATIDSVNDNVYCATGNCTYGTYRSLAVCSQCDDISDKISGGLGSGAFLLPEGYDLSLDASFGFLNMTSTSAYPISENLPETGPLIATFQALAMAEAQRGPVATECAIYWCVHEYNGTSVNNVMEETVTATWTNMSITTDYDDPTTIIIQPDECIQNGTRKDSDTPGCTFIASNHTQSALQNYLIGYVYKETVIEPFLSGQVYINNSDLADPSWIVSTAAASAIYTAATAKQLQDFNQIYDIRDVITTAIEEMALYMTNSIRRTEGGRSLPQSSLGQATLTSQHFHVRWGWMVYPICLVICTFIFFIITLIKCEKSHTHLWKTSVIAMMFHPFSEHEIDEFLSLGSLEEMKEAMHRHKVHLVNNRFKPHGRSDYEAGKIDERGIKAATVLGSAAVEPLMNMIR